MKTTKAIIFIFCIVALSIYGYEFVKAQSKGQEEIVGDGIKLLPSTIPVNLDLQRGVLKVLANGAKDRAIFVYAITDVNQRDDYYIVSVAGLPADAAQMQLQDSVWLGIVTISEGPEFIGSVQDLTVNQQPQNFDKGGSQNILPFRSGTTATYGMLGVHNCGFSLNGWKAVDLFPQENMVYSANDGKVTYVCRDSTQIALRIGNYLYTHLEDTGQTYGDDYTQGQAISGLIPGTYDDTCGYADQQSDHYHVHFCFQTNPAGTWAADGYALNVNNGNWVKGEETVSPGGTLTASWENANGDPIIPGPTNRGNIWDIIIKGATSLYEKSLAKLPIHSDMGISNKVLDRASPVLALLFPTTLSIFSMAIPMFVIFAVILLEGVRIIYAIYMLIKRLIPFVG